jgi:hypothetical protein
LNGLHRAGQQDAWGVPASRQESVDAARVAIDRQLADRNAYFQANPRRPGKKGWGKSITPSEFSASNNCKDRHRGFVGI